MPNTLTDLARDPSMIPHVYDYCDQWCRYCRVAPRCLAYKSAMLRAVADPLEEAEEIPDGIDWIRIVADATGTDVARLDVQLSDSTTFEPPDGIIGDPLETMGRQYMIAVNLYLQSTQPSETVLTADSEATPINVVSWLHMTIAYKTFRALLSSHKATHGEPSLEDDAKASAKLVLTSIERSREAFDELLGAKGSDRRLRVLRDYLERLAVAVEARFPEARGFVRAGLDEE